MTTTQVEARPGAAGPMTLPIVLIAQFVTPLSIAGTAIALPLISGDLGASPTGLQWVVNGFNVAFAVFTLVWGAISDRLGYRVTFQLGGALVAAAGLISAVAPSLLVLDIARVVGGIGAAAVLTGATSILSNAYDGAKRTRAFALFGTINGLGLALGPSISGALIAGLGWRGVFAAQAAVIAIAIASSGVIPKIKIEQETSAPIFDVSLLRNREFLAMCLVPVGGSIAFVTFLTYLPSAFSGIKDMPAGVSGAVMLVMTLPVLIAPMVIAKIVTASEKIGVHSVVAASFAALILGTCGLFLLSGDHSWSTIIPAMLLLGLGFGLPIGLVDGHALSVVPPERSGTAAGVLNFFRVGSEAIFVALYAFTMELLVSSRLQGGEANRTAAGQFTNPEVYQWAFNWVVTGVLVLVIAIALAVAGLRKRTHSSLQA